ncbi:MAG TPA: hypothetical protein VGG72_19755 [Bryobacteraceae bacterium]
MALYTKASSAWGDRHLQSFLLRGRPDSSGASGVAPRRGPCGTAGPRKKRRRHLGIALSLHRQLESHLYRNATRTVKIFLHLSHEEQRKRFLERIDEPEKNWKFSLADIREREYWKQYMKAYEACLEETSTHHAPWYIVPADDKENARLMVSQIVLDTLQGLNLAYPKPTAKRRRELKAIRKLLTN